MKEINDMTVAEALDEINVVKERYQTLLKLFNKSEDIIEQESSKEYLNHGYCFVILEKGFIYIGELHTNDKFLKIKNPKNIRKYTSGKGLLWHVENGSEDMVLDSCNIDLKAPYKSLSQFIRTDKKLWV